MASKPSKPRKPRKRTPKPKVPAEAELKPHKIVGQLIGAIHNEHGEIVGEESMGEVAIFKPNFSKLPDFVEAAVKVRRKEEERARGEG